jgi:hypothetical protein
MLVDNVQSEFVRSSGRLANYFKLRVAPEQLLSLILNNSCTTLLKALADIDVLC